MHKCKLIDRHITHQLATDICCGISFFVFEKYTNYVKEKKLGEAIDILLGLYNKGYSIVNKEIGNVEELNRELRETNREVNMKFLNVKYF